MENVDSKRIAVATGKHPAIATLSFDVGWICWKERLGERKETVEDVGRKPCHFADIHPFVGTDCRLDRLHQEIYPEIDIVVEAKADWQSSRSDSRLHRFDWQPGQQSVLDWRWRYASVDNYDVTRRWIWYERSAATWPIGSSSFSYCKAVEGVQEM